MRLRTLWEVTTCVCLAGQLSGQAYWRRLRQGRSPFSPTFDVPRRLLRRAELDARALPREPFLRPTRESDCHAPEVVALADEIRAGARDDWQYAEKIFDYVRNGIDYCLDLPSRRGVVGTLERGFGTCNDKLNVLVALARAGGIPARYCTIGIAPGEAGVHSLSRDDMGIFGAVTGRYRRFLTEDNDLRAKRIAALVLRLLSSVRRAAKARARGVSESSSVLSFGHYIAELQVGPDWIPADPTLSDADCGWISQRFGDKPMFLWPIVGMTINGRTEAIPPGPRRPVLWLTYAWLGRGFFDHMNDACARQRSKGGRLLSERVRKAIVPVGPAPEDRPATAMTERA